MLPLEDRELLNQTMLGLNIDSETIASLMQSFDTAAEGLEADPITPVPTTSFGDSYTGGYRLGTNVEMAQQSVGDELKKMRLVSDYHVLQGYRNDQAHLTFLPGYAGDASLDRFARLHEKVVEEDDGDVLERVDDVVVGGEYNAFHFLDTSDPKEENHTYGLVFLNGSWTIHIGFYNESIGDVQPLTPEEREQATASILASFEPTFAG